jgi:hypothetical protein
MWKDERGFEKGLGSGGILSVFPEESMKTKVKILQY